METAIRSSRRRRHSARTAARRLTLEALENRQLLAVLASDGFESDGGAGWTGQSWSMVGDAAVIDTNNPHGGSFHARLRASSGDLQRAVDVTGASDLRLQFWSKQSSFEGNDKALVSISYDGAAWTTLLQLTKNQSDNQYRFYDLSVPASGNTLYVRFDAAMNAADDYWFIDDVAITGTPSGPPQISISDATISEIGDVTAFIAPGSGGLSSPRDLVQGPDGNIYVASQGTNSVLRYSGTTGAFLGTFVASGSGGLNLPDGVAFGPDGNFYVASGETDAVYKYNGTTGAFLSAFVPTGSGGLDNPRGIAFGLDGNLYVSSFYTHSILRYSGSTGSFLDAFVPSGSGGLSRPLDVVFGPDGDLYVSIWDQGSPSAVSRFDGVTGNFVSNFVAQGEGGVINPRGLAFDQDGRLYLADYSTQSIHRYDNQGQYLDDLAVSGGSSLRIPMGIIFDAQGSLLISSNDYNTHSVVRYDRGVLLTLSETSPTSVTVDYQTINGSATSPSDYSAQAGTVTFAPGQTSRRILLASHDDVLTNGSRNFSVQLSNATGDATIGAANAVVTIIDDDAARQVTISDATTVEGDHRAHYRGSFIEVLPGVNLANSVMFHGGYFYASPGPSSMSPIDRYDAATGAFVDHFIPARLQLQGIRSPLIQGEFLYVGSEYTDEIQRYDAITGAPAGISGVPGDAVFVSADSGISGSHGLAFGPDGNLYVTSRDGFSVLRFNGTNGQPLGSFDTTGSGALSWPEGMTIDVGGVAYVTSPGSNKIQKYNAATGAYLGAITNPAMQNPKDVTFGTDGLLYVLTNNRILRFTAAGAFVDDYVAPGSGGMNNLANFSFGPDGDLYVSGYNENNFIYRFGTANEAVFTVTLSAPSSLPLTVDFSTADNTAIASGDYTATSGTVTFGPGVTTKTILVPLLDDTAMESNETFVVNLSNPSGGVLADSQGVGTIQDNDFAGGLVSWWRADNTATDSASHNDGTLYNGATYAAGQVGQAFSFDGVNDRINIADSPSLALTQSLTIEGWIKANSIPAQGQQGEILFRGDDRGGLDPYSLSLQPNGMLRFEVSGLTEAANVWAPMPLGQFVHVVGTLDDDTGSMSLYLNGVLISQLTTTARPFGALDPASNPGIGIGNHGGYPTTPHNFPFNGLIDDLKVYNRALADTEVLNNFYAGKGDLQPSLTINDTTVTEGEQTTNYLGNLANPSTPYKMAYGPDGNLYVSTLSGNSVLRYDATSGAPLPAPGKSGAEFVAPGAGGLDVARDLAFGPDGNLYVVGQNNGAVLRFDAVTGEPLGSLVAPGSGGLDGPRGLLFHSDGYLYVTSVGNTAAAPGFDAILRFNAVTGAPAGVSGQPDDAVFIASGTGGLDNPSRIVFHNDEFYVASTSPSTSNSVLRFANDGNFLGAFVPTGSGGLAGPADLTFRNGYLYVVSWTNSKVLRYDGATGAFLNEVVSGNGLVTPLGILFEPSGNFLVTSRDTNEIRRYGESAAAVFTVSLNAPFPTAVSVDFNTQNGTALAPSDYQAASGTITFAPGQTSRTILIQTIDDSLVEGTETFTISITNAVGGVIGDSQGFGTILDDETPATVTKFYVVDAGVDRTFEYGSSGQTLAGDDWALAAANTNPRGATANATGSRLWVVDTLGTVYIYDNNGASLGTWTAGGVRQAEGITTDGINIWIVDARDKRTLYYAGGALLESGTHSPTSTFALWSGNENPTGITTDGTYLWVCDDDRRNSDNIWRYTLSGQLQGGWDLPSANSKTAGITIDPTGQSDSIWVVDSGTDKVYEYKGIYQTTFTNLTLINTFSLAAGNTNPTDIADPRVAVNLTVEILDNEVTLSELSLLGGLPLLPDWPSSPPAFNAHSKSPEDLSGKIDLYFAAASQYDCRVWQLEVPRQHDEPFTKRKPAASYRIDLDAANELFALEGLGTEGGLLRPKSP